jgi:hypothetical protein
MIHTSNVYFKYWFIKIDINNKEGGLNEYLHVSLKIDYNNA